MKIILLCLLIGLNSFASTNRVLDGATITNGSATLTIPSSTDTLVGKDTTDTLTNKTMSGASNTFTAIPASAVSSGQLSIANGGTGQSTANTALNAFLPSQSSNSGKYLTTDGTNTAWGSVSVTPNVSGSQASPNAITAAGGIAFTGTNYSNMSFIAGSGGAVTVTATPQIAAAGSVGQMLILLGTSATNTVTLADGNGLGLNGAWVGGNNSSLTLIWNGSVWYEVSRR